MRPAPLEPTAIVSLVAGVSFWQYMTRLLLRLQAEGSLDSIQNLQGSLCCWSSFKTDSLFCRPTTKAIRMTRHSKTSSTAEL